MSKAKYLTMCTHGDPHEVGVWMTPYNRSWADRVAKVSKHVDPTGRQRWCPGSMLAVSPNVMWPNETKVPA